MVNQKQAKKFCCEDFSLIENYDKASKDLIQTWDIHHRKEEEGYSKQELIDFGMYYERPASELIFLTHKEHVSLHMKGHKYNSGEKNPMYGRTGEKNPMYGKTGEEHNRSKPIHQIDKQTCHVIKTWPCTWEVERVLGINQSDISKCCKGKLKSAGGFCWRYAKSESLT